VLLPPALLNRVAPYLEAAAALVRTGEVSPDGFNPPTRLSSPAPLRPTPWPRATTLTALSAAHSCSCPPCLQAGPARAPRQPVPLIVIAQQYLRHGKADQLGVGHLRRAAHPAPAVPREAMMRSVSSTWSAIRRVSRSAVTNTSQGSGGTRHADHGQCSLAGHGCIAACRRTHANGVLPDRGLGGECCGHGLDGPVLVFGDGPAALPGEQVEEV
jgi:hypothetical protein